jgi:hypothetical protein
MASDHAEDFFFLHCNWQTIDCCWSGSSKRQWQSTDTNHPTTQMEVGWEPLFGRPAGGRTHTHVSVQASHAVFNLSGVAGDPKLSLSRSLGGAPSDRRFAADMYWIRAPTRSVGWWWWWWLLVGAPLTITINPRRKMHSE